MVIQKSKKDTKKNIKNKAKVKSDKNVLEKILD